VQALTQIQTINSMSASTPSLLGLPEYLCDSEKVSIDTKRSNLGRAK
jgi:hypothetical protein